MSMVLGYPATSMLLDPAPPTVACCISVSTVFRSTILQGFLMHSSLHS